ncbi:MAG: hypothetical protein WDW38_008794 [Sanguina aurantia]
MAAVEKPLGAMDLNSALAFLTQAHSTDGGSVYEHLTKVLEDKPNNALDLLEASYLIKKTAFSTKESSPLVPISAAADAARAIAGANIFGNPDLPIDPDSGEPIEAEAPNDFEGEDIVDASVLFEAVGCGLGTHESYGVAMAAHRLGESPSRGVAKVRFFGKIFGTHADYYVFETTLKDPPEAPTAPEGEVPYEENVGTNAYVYWVCNYLGGKLERLPPVTPGQIRSARQIKKFLTGDLDAHVSTYPLFPGAEKHFLRAQIARIVAATVLAPAGKYSAEEEGVLAPTEDFVALSGREMGSTSSWVHYYPHLKRQGRCDLFKREEPEDEEELERFAFTEDELEEGPEPLVSVEEDTPLAGADAGIQAWTPVVSARGETVKFQVGGVRSNTWPGAVSVAAGDGRYSNVYVGWAVKAALFVPLPPPPVATEYDAALVESKELPPKPAPPPAEEEEPEEE